MKWAERLWLRLWWVTLSQLNQFWLAFTLFGVSGLGLAQGWWTPIAGVFGMLLGLAVLGLSRSEGKQRVLVAKRCVAELEARLVGRALPRGDFRVASVFWYGAVDISPAHCVVWLLLHGDADRIPHYLQGERLPQVPDEALRDWLAGLRAESLAIFRSQGWRRTWPPPSVGFESESRASWDYFR